MPLLFSMIQTQRNKLLIAILSGLLCFVFSPYGLAIHWSNQLVINLPWSIVFPIVVSLAYGWRYALISGLSGGALFPFYIWFDNGYPDVSTTFVYLIFYILLGLVKDKPSHAILKHKIVRLIIAYFTGIVIFYLYYLFGFEVLLAQNPPFWNTNAIQSIDSGVAYNFFIKDSLNFLASIIIAASLLKLPQVSWLLGLPYDDSSQKNTSIFFSALFIGFLVWLSFYVLNKSLFQPSLQLRSEHLTLSFLVIITSSLIVAYLIMFFYKNQYNSNLKLQESERKYKSLTENSIDYIVRFSTRYQYEYLNTATCQFLGVEPQQILHKTPRQTGLFTEDQSRLWEKQIDKVMETGDIIQTQLNVNLQNGSYFWDVMLIPELDKQGEIINVLSISRDISALRLYEQKLISAKNLAEKSEERFRHLFDNNPVALWEEDFSEVSQLISEAKKQVVDIETYILTNDAFVALCAQKIKVLSINRATLDLFDYGSENEIIENLSATFNQTSFQTFKNLLVGIAMEKQTFIEQTEYLKSDGSIIYAIVYVFFKTGKKSVVAIVDNTKQKHAENELVLKYKQLQKSEEDLKQANEQLIEAKDRAEESDRLKTEFINNMSHEIRTPMNGILGFSSFLDDPNLTDTKRTQYVRLIQSSSHQLLRVIDDILEISKLGTKQVTAVYDRTNINDLLHSLFSVFETKAKENKTPLYLKMEFSDDEAYIFSDQSKLYKVLSNLLENALKFTNQGFIEFGYHLRNNQLVFFVKDTGIGIKAENLGMIFKRFSQEEKKLSRSVGGLGLGLSIAKENTELLGGAIEVESEKGKGATFYVVIPYKPVAPKNAQIHSTGTPIYTVLIAEDEEINSLFLHTYLQNYKKKIKTLHAKNGFEAVELCQSTNSIQLVLMDIKMPGLDGLAATERIKKHKPHLPVVAQTAHITKADKNMAKEAGCDDFLTKPIQHADLDNILNKYLK